MNESALADFLSTHKQATLATVRKDGRPQLSNVLTAYRDGRLLISTRETTAKFRNLERDPRCTLLILGENFYRFVTLSGRATFIRLPEARIPLRQYYELASGGPHPDWNEYDEAMVRERRVLVIVELAGVDHAFNVG